MSDFMVANLDKYEREAKRWIEKWNPKKAKLIIKKMDEEYKWRMRGLECNMCLKHDIDIYPALIWMCNDCVRKYANRYGKIHIILKQNKFDPVRLEWEKCQWCKKSKITHFYVNMRVCTKCSIRIGKKLDPKFKMPKAG